MSTVIWFSGLSGSGKTTVAGRLQLELEKLGKTVLILDGDTVRNTQHKHLGFSREDIRENNRLIAELAKQKMLDFNFILIPLISPYKEDRANARILLGQSFIELFVKCPLQQCIARDVKGLYKKALAGEIPNFIGLSDSNPYENPDHPELEINTDQLNLDESVDKIILFLKERKLI